MIEMDFSNQVQGGSGDLYEFILGIWATDNRADSICKLHYKYSITGEWGRTSVYQIVGPVRAARSAVYDRLHP